MAFNTLCIFGTRPEAIKMAPLIKQLASMRNFTNKVCITGQHKQMLHSVLDNFGIVADFNLNVMSEGQDLTNLTVKILSSLNILYQS